MSNLLAFILCLLLVCVILPGAAVLILAAIAYCIVYWYIPFALFMTYYVHTKVNRKLN